MKGKELSTDNPTKFEDFDTKELLEIAVEGFALDVKPDDNKKTLLAAFAEANLSWEDYRRIKPDAAPADVVAPVAAKPVQEEINELSQDQIITASNPVHNAGAKYLVVMERENPLFEIKGYRFTKDNPYALVTAEAAEVILREPGFRQAFPSELKEFYPAN